MKREGVLVGGSIVAALLASVCCIGPVLIAVLGVGVGVAGVFPWFESVRPALTILTIGLFGTAVYFMYRKPRKTVEECGEGKACAVPSNKRLQKTMLWIAGVVALLSLTFPYYVGYLF